LSNLGKTKYFSTIDLESGFRQILMNKTDIQKTSFSINNGKYEFLRIPFGLTNEQVGKTCLDYMDDIIIFSKTIEQITKI